MATQGRIEAFLLEQNAKHKFPVTILHPGHLVGPGWVPLNPAANFDPGIFGALARGDEILLPNFAGRPCTMCHCSDVAQAFVRAIGNWPRAVDRASRGFAGGADTDGYAESVAKLVWAGSPYSASCRGRSGGPE